MDNKESFDLYDDNTESSLYDGHQFEYSYASSSESDKRNIEMQMQIKLMMILHKPCGPASFIPLLRVPT